MLRETLRFLLASSLVLSCSTSTTTQAGSSKDDGGNAGDQGSSVGGGPLASGGNAGTASQGGNLASGGNDSAAGVSATATGGTIATGGTSSTGGAASGELSCSTYCAAVQSNCATDTLKQYKSDTSCMNSCAAFRLGTLNDTSGNTLGCRARAATLAVADPATNCAIAGPSGGGRCGTNCDSYCALMATICPSVFEDESLCRAECLKMTGVGQTTYQAGGSGDNLQCRIYHATFAAEGFPELHCTHAAPVPIAPCAS